MTGEFRLPAVVLLFFYTCCRNELNFVKVIRQVKIKRFLQLQPALADCIPLHRSFIPSPICDIPSSPRPYLPFNQPFSPHCYIFTTFQPSLIFSPARLLFLSAPERQGGSRRRVCSAQGLSCYRVLNAMETKFSLHNSMCVCACV